MSTEKILNRVQKMLALGKDSGATEAERDTAMKMAYKLLAKHNLTLADLPEEQSECREMLVYRVHGNKWIGQVCNQIARLFFCKYFFMRTSVAGVLNHHFVGRQSNVETARYMAEFIVKGIKREASKRYGQATSHEGRAFGTGVSVTIILRVNELLAKQDLEDTPGTAIVIYNLHKAEQQANEQWISQNTNVTISTTKTKFKDVDAHAYADGKEFGKTVSLNRQVPETKTSAKRLA